MDSVIRKVLIVDDSPYTGAIKIDEYKDNFSKIKMKDPQLYKYELEFAWENNITSALERLDCKNEVFHVLLVDYEFNNDEYNFKGIDFVNKVRKTINKKCKIIFYTMRGYMGIDKKEYVDLINSNIFKFISKSGESLEFVDKYNTDNADEIIVNTIIEAINESDPISNALEDYLLKYYDIMKDNKVRIQDKDYTIQQLIDNIRMDTEVGKYFVEKMLKMSILDYIRLDD